MSQLRQKKETSSANIPRRELPGANEQKLQNKVVAGKKGFGLSEPMIRADSG